MKKVFAILPLIALVACGSTKPAPVSTAPVLPTEQYDNRVAVNQIDREAQINKSIAQSPKWMTDLPTSNNAVYANGSAVSSDMSMADYKAKLFAFGKICMAAGGKVNQQAKVYMQDTAEASTEISELAIKSMCPSVALPTVDANALQKRKDQLRLKDRAEQRSTDAFKEMDKTADLAPVKNTPTVQLYPDPTAQ